MMVLEILGKKCILLLQKQSNKFFYKNYFHLIYSLSSSHMLASWPVLLFSLHTSFLNYNISVKRNIFLAIMCCYLTTSQEA